MPQPRVLIGYRTPHRNSEAVILTSSTNLTTFQAVVDSPECAEFQRFEVGMFTFQRRLRRSRTNVTEGADQAAEEVPEIPAADAPEDPASQESESDADEGPTLGVPEAPPKRR